MFEELLVNLHKTAHHAHLSMEFLVMSNIRISFLRFRIIFLRLLKVCFMPLIPIAKLKKQAIMWIIISRETVICFWPVRV